jgi:Flp pilus assembly CpaE family ATPase
MSQNYSSTPLVVIVDPSETDRTASRELLINSGRAHVIGVAKDATELGRYMAADPDIVLLHLHSNHGIHELMRNVDDLDADILDNVMVAHSSGVKVLLPPPNLDLVEDVATEGMTAVLKALRKFYDYVVVDTWHSIEDATLAVMDLSSTLLLITTPEVPSLRNTRRLLDLIRERPDLRGKAQIVVNRYPSKSAVGMREIEHSLGMKPVGTIPSDGHLITTAINEGVSFLSRPSAAAANLTALATYLAQPRMARDRRGGAVENAKRPSNGRFNKRVEGSRA